MRNIPVLSTNSGYMTPLVDAREDIEKYRYGCRTLKNMIPRIYGPAQRRPGTKYINSVKYPAKKTRMIPFVYSSTIAYQVEFGNLYCRFYYDGAIVTTDGTTPVEITTPYLEADLNGLRYIQSADVMWITHPSYAPRKLSRVSETSFKLEEIVFNKGPFLPRNDLENQDGVTLIARGYAVEDATAGTDHVGNFTITTSEDLTELFPKNKRFYISGSPTNDGAYTVSDTTATTYVGTTLTIYTNEGVLSTENGGELTVEGGTGIMVASSDMFDEGHVGALFKITHKRVQSSVEGTLSIGVTGKLTEAIEVKGAWTATSHKTWDGTVEIQRMEDGLNWETYRTYTSNDDFNFQKSDVETFDNVKYRLYVTEHKTTSKTGIRGVITVDDSTQDGIVRVTAYTSPTQVTVEHIVPVPLTTPAYRWAEGAWSEYRGYPKCLTFFEERIVYGLTNYNPNQIWLSQTGDFENFEAGTNDNRSFSLVLPTADEVTWVDSLDALLIGTSGGEWRVRSNALDEPLTPTNFSLKQQTSWGSKDIESLKVSNAIIEIDYVGRKLREIAWNEEQQKFTAPDLTNLAENITLGGIGGYAYQRNPDSMIWMWLDNPYYDNGDLISFISMTYDRSQNVIAFSMHPLAPNKRVPYGLSNLFGHWKMNDAEGQTVVLDSSTGSHNGTSANNITSVTGKIGTAIDFNGTSDYVNVGNLSAEMRGLSCWFYNDDIITPALSQQTIIDFTGDSFSRLTFGQCYGAPGLYHEMITLLDSNGGRTYYAVEDGSIASGWHHLALSWNGTSYDMYLDNYKLTTTVAGTPKPVYCADVEFGRRTISPTYFNGKLDDIRFYRSNLRESEISALYNKGSGTEDVGQIDEYSYAEVESVCVTPSTDEDVVTIIAKRTIDGETVRYIEQLQPFDFGTETKDCFFVDCGLSYDYTPERTFSGLDHLEGENVTILGDGAVFADKIVVDGSVTIDEEVSVCHIGLRSTYQLAPMRLAGNPGEIMGLERTIPEVLVSFYKTAGASYGDGVYTYPIDFRTTEDYGSPPALFTGEKKLPFNSGFTTQDTIIISGSDPLPCTVRAIVPNVEI